MDLIPVNINYTQEIKNIKIEISNLILFHSCSFRVILFNENQEIINIKFFTLEGDDYIQWNNDDFVVEWIKNQLT